MTDSPNCQACGTPLARGRSGDMCPTCLLRVAMGGESLSPAAPQPLPDLAALQALFPDLEIIGLLGRGGMGAVYQVRQPSLERMAALKILPPDLAGEPGFRERFHREARTMAALNHPNIVTIHDFGEHGGVFFFLMEYVDGGDLGRAIRSGTLTVREALAIVPQICEALQYAHDSGVVHRDIKPGNILLDSRGRVKVADFGIAKIVGAASDPGLPRDYLLGTPEYMAPEQREGAGEVDHRADIYSLGAVFYELLTGKPPVEGHHPAPSECMTLDARIDDMVLRAMATDPQLRYQQVSELREAVERITRRSRAVWPITVGVLLGASIIASALWWRDRPAVAVDPFPPVWENSLGMKFRLVPGTDLRLSIWETRVGDWQAFEAGDGLPTGARRATGNPLEPLAIAEGERIRAFCAWLTRTERAAGRIGKDEIYRLPSDHEWSLAVGLQEAADAAPMDLHLKDREHYPWGTRAPIPDDAGNYADSALRERMPNAVVVPNYYDGHAYAAPVGSFPANPAGFHDLGGNLWEAVSTGAGDEAGLVYRGGSWAAGATDGDWTCLLSSFRASPKSVSPLEAGFRVVLAKAGATPKPNQLAAAREGDLASLTEQLAAGAEVNQRDAMARTALHWAACGGYADAVAALIKAGADIAAKDKNGETPLHGAAAAGSLPAVQALVQAGAKVRTRITRTGMEPIHLAVKAGRPELLDLLASHGADLQVIDNLHNAPLHYAASAGARDAIEWLAARKVPLDAPGLGEATALGMAAFGGDEETCALLLRLGAAPNPTSGALLSPLAWAVMGAHPEVVALLLRHDADPKPVMVGTAAGMDPATLQPGKPGKDRDLPKLPLLPASQPGNRAAVIRLLVEHGMPLEQRDPQGYTPLLNAAYRGNTEAVQTLLELGATPDAADKDGFTALHSAAEQGFLKLVELLLGKGAQPDVPNGEGSTALYCAALTGHREVVERLLNAGANVEGLPQALSTPVQTAAEHGHASVLALLLERGGNPNAVTKATGMTALIGAAFTAPKLLARNSIKMSPPLAASPHGEQADYVHCVSLLLEHGANPRAAMNDGTTALHAAADSNQAEAVTLLLKAGVAPDLLDHESFTPLHRAAQSEAADAAKVLLDKGANPVPPLNPSTPLHVAAKAGAVKVATLLFEHGVAPNPRDGVSATPLHWAVQTGQTDMIGLLAKHGADLAARDFTYNTPLHTAVNLGKVEIVRALLAAGANPALRNMEGATPLDIARARRLSEMVTVLSQPSKTSIPQPPPPMKTIRSLTPILLSCCCWLLAPPLLTRAEDAAVAEPAVFEALTAADKLLAAKKVDEAVAILRAALREPGLPPDDVAVANLHLKLAFACRQSNKHAEAYTAAAAAAPIFEQAMGRENPFALCARWLAAREAMAANQAAEAAQQAAPLLETLRDYVTSGRAAKARWEDVPGLQPLLAELPALNEAGLAAVASLLGRAWAAAGEPDKALPVLRGAAALLENLHGRGHPELVEVQQVLEALAAKRGEDAGRRYVGDLGSSLKLVFEGNATFAAEDLRKALAMDVGFVLASHPAAEFADFPPVIQKGLHAGYLSAGFPQAAVAVTRDGECLRVRITEGSRCRMGNIRIEGTREVDPDKLRQKLLVVAKDATDSTFAGLLRKTMLGYRNLLPQTAAEDAAAKATIDNINKQIPSGRWGADMGNMPKEAVPGAEQGATFPDFLQNMLSSQLSTSSGGKADWVPGDPVKFLEDDTNPLLATVHQYLAELGRPMARLSTAHEFRDDDTVDLVIRIEDEGPAAVVGRVDVVGCTRDSVEEVAAAAGLVAGQPVTPMLLDKATVALWNTGRFFPFTITFKARDQQAWEVDLTIQVREIAGVPPLTETLAPELESARRFIATLNEWMATGKFTDYQLTSTGADGERTVLGFSSRDGLIVENRSGDSRECQVVSVARNEICFDLTSGDHRGRGRLPGPSEKSSVWIHLLPGENDDGKLCYGAGIGVSSSQHNTGRLPIDLVIIPALPMLKPEMFLRDGDQVVVSDKNGREWLRLDLASALPVAGENTGFEFRDGVVKERQAALATEIGASTNAEPIIDWLEAVMAVLRFTAAARDADAELEEFYGSRIRLAALLLKSDALKPFKELYSKWTAERAGKDNFSIPVDPALMQSGATMTLLVSFGAIVLSEMLAPPDSWVSKLTRELVFIYGGKTQYTARTIEELLADPAMGPIGCRLTAQMLMKFNEATARRFLAKALDQATAEGFRRDWRLLLDSPVGLGQAVEKFLTALAATRPEDEQAAADLLDPRYAQWLTGFLARLRERSADESVAAWITPQMDQLWEAMLEASFRQKLEAILNPACDANRVIAMVNGQPVLRAVVRTIEDSNPGVLDTTVPPPVPDPARPWTMRPALGQAIRLSLLAPWPQPLDQAKVDAMSDQVTTESFPLFEGKPEEDWIATFGMPRREFGMLGIQCNIATKRVKDEVTQKLPATLTDDLEPALAAWWQEHAATLGRQGHVHVIRSTANDNSAVAGERATRLARETAAAIRAGLPFVAMTAAAFNDKDGGLQLSCTTDMTLLDLKAEFARELATLRPDEFTPVLQAANQRWTAALVAWNPVEPPAFDAVKNEVFACWLADEFRQSVNRLMQPLEATASIELLDEPAAAEAPADPSVFELLAEEDPASAIGQLGCCWQKALAHDPAAAAALDKVLASRLLDPPSLVLLADALLAHDQRPLAARCVKDAAARDLAATRNAIKEAVAGHQETGTTGQQDQLEQVLESP